MKTIVVSDEMYDELLSLSKEMMEQDPRGTRMPHMFQIRDWEKVYDHNLNGDVTVFLDDDYNEIVTLDDFKEYLHDMEIDGPDELDEWWNDEFCFQYDLSDWIESNCPGLKKTTYTLEPVYKNCFLTAKAAEEHLKGNYYHYHVDADIYLNHAWRNYEMLLISDFLCGLYKKQ